MPVSQWHRQSPRHRTSGPAETSFDMPVRTEEALAMPRVVTMQSVVAALTLALPRRRVIGGRVGGVGSSARSAGAPSARPPALLRRLPDGTASRGATRLADRSGTRQPIDPGIPETALTPGGAAGFRHCHVSIGSTSPAILHGEVGSGSAELTSRLAEVVPGDTLLARLTAQPPPQDPRGSVHAPTVPSRKGSQRTARPWRWGEGMPGRVPTGDPSWLPRGGSDRRVVRLTISR